MRMVVCRTCFNPRTHGGCDASLNWSQPCYAMFQSTHPRGVRPHSSYVSNTKRLFQSTHPRGVRPPLDLLPHLIESFQSTHPRGVRQYLQSSSFAIVGFNPRTHGGCDKRLPEYRTCLGVSIHAPTGGATLSSSSRQRRFQVSIHAPTGGATMLRA